MCGQCAVAASDHATGSMRCLPAFSLLFSSLVLTCAFAATRKLPAHAPTEPPASSWLLPFCTRQATAVAATPTRASMQTATATHTRTDEACRAMGNARQSRRLALLMSVVTREITSSWHEVAFMTLTQCDSLRIPINNIYFGHILDGSPENIRDEHHQIR
jgi:hypothetical protein